MKPHTNVPTDFDVRRFKCHAKQPFESERIAGKRAEERQGQPGVPPLFPYRCAICKKWHLTRRPPEEQFKHKHKLVLRGATR